MAWHQRAGKAVMRCHRQPLALRLVQPRIGGDDPDGGVLRRRQASCQRHIDRRPGRCRAKPAKFVIQFPGRGPHMRHTIGRGRAMRVHRDQRTNSHAVIQHSRGRAKPAFHRPGRGAISGPGAAKVKFLGPRLPGGGPKTRIGIVMPCLVAAIQQVKQDRRRHNRDFLSLDIEADSRRTQRIGHPRRGIEAKGRPARKHQCVYVSDKLVRGKKIGLARARGTAHDMNRGGEGMIGGQHRHPRFHRRIMRIANTDAGHIGDQIAMSWFHG